MEMYFHSNQHPQAIKHPFISQYSKYKSLKYIRLPVMNSPPFSVADTQLYKRLCPSLGRLVRRSVEVTESKSGKTSVLEAFCVCVCVGKGVGSGVGCGWGSAAPTHPSATIL